MHMLYQVKRAGSEQKDLLKINYRSSDQSWNMLAQYRTQYGIHTYLNTFT